MSKYTLSQAATTEMHALGAGEVITVLAEGLCKPATLQYQVKAQLFKCNICSCILVHLHAENVILVFAFLAEGLTLDLFVAFQRGLSCCSTRARPTTRISLLLKDDVDLHIRKIRRWTRSYRYQRQRPQSIVGSERTSLCQPPATIQSQSQDSQPFCQQ